MSKRKEPKELSDALTALSLEIARSMGYNEAQSVERVIRAIKRSAVKVESDRAKLILAAVDTLPESTQAVIADNINCRIGRKR
jgi:K+ transporter